MMCLDLNGCFQTEKRLGSLLYSIYSVCMYSVYMYMFILTILHSTFSPSFLVAIEHIHHTHMVRDERERKTQALRKEIEELNTAIAQCQEMLPASGVPVTRQVCVMNLVGLPRQLVVFYTWPFCGL